MKHTALKYVFTYIPGKYLKAIISILDSDVPGLRTIEATSPTTANDHTVEVFSPAAEYLADTSAVGVLADTESFVVGDENAVNKPHEENTSELDADVLEILDNDPTNRNSFENIVQKDLAVYLEQSATEGLSKNTLKGTDRLVSHTEQL